MKRYRLNIKGRSLEDIYAINEETIKNLLDEKEEFKVETDFNDRYSSFADLFFHDIKDDTKSLFDDLIIRYSIEAYGKVDKETIFKSVMFMLEWLLLYPIKSEAEIGEKYDIFDIDRRSMYFRAYIDFAVIKKYYPSDIYEGSPYGYEPYRVSYMPAKEIARYLLRRYYIAKIDHYRDVKMTTLTEMYIGLA